MMYCGPYQPLTKESGTFTDYRSHASGNRYTAWVGRCQRQETLQNLLTREYIRAKVLPIS